MADKWDGNLSGDGSESQRNMDEHRDLIQDLGEYHGRLRLVKHCCVGGVCSGCISSVV